MGCRMLLATGVLAGVISVLGAPSGGEAAQASAASDQGLERVARAIGELRDELREERQFSEIGSIRSAQKQFLRLNGKLPDFLEVGADVWFQAYDWHVRWHVPAVEGRDPQRRLTLTMNQTAVILRADVSANYVGPPYDAR